LLSIVISVNHPVFTAQCKIKNVFCFERFEAFEDFKFKIIFDCNRMTSLK